MENIIGLSIVLGTANLIAGYLVINYVRAKDHALKAARAHINRMGLFLTNLDEERRVQHETLNEVFDFLNDNSPFVDVSGKPIEGLAQCRNVLMTTIQTSTYGRDGT